MTFEYDYFYIIKEMILTLCNIKNDCKMTRKLELYCYSPIADNYYTVTLLIKPY